MATNPREEPAAPSGPTIRTVTFPDEMETVRLLFREYADSRR
jgi:hypothetical protein